VLDAADQPVEAEPAQLMGHLAGVIAGAEQSGGQGTQALVGDTAGPDSVRERAPARAMTPGRRTVRPGPVIARMNPQALTCQQN
jgi:hypothetical protein